MKGSLMPNRPESFAEVVGKWSRPRLGQFLIAAAEFVGLESQSPLAAEQRQASALRTAKQLLPLVIGPRESPLRIVVDALRQIASVHPELLKGSFVWTLKQPASKITMQSLSNLLELLVMVDFGDAEFVVTLAIQRLNNEAEWSDVYEQCAESLIYLSGLSGGALGALSTVDRFRSSGSVSIRLIEAALRIVASTEPSRLPQAFRLLNDDLNTVSYREDIVSLLRDLVMRSSLLGVLQALVELIPMQHPVLFRAAFGRAPGDGAFLIQRAHSIFGSSHLLISMGEQRCILDELFSPLTQDPAEPEWTEKLYLVLGYTPPSFVIELASADEGRSDPNELIISSISEQPQIADAEDEPERSSSRFNLWENLKKGHLKRTITAALGRQMGRVVDVDN